MFRTAFPQLILAACLTGGIATAASSATPPLFDALPSFPTGREPYNLAIGDLNQDGKADLVTANEVDGSISVLFGNGDGSYPTHTDTAIGPYAHFVSAGDVDGDGKQDLVVTSGVNAIPPSTMVSLLRGNGDGTFQPKVDYPVPPPTTGFTSLVTFLALGDLNRDGRQDVVTGFTTGISVRLGRGDGTLGPSSEYESPDALTLAVLDANGDSNPDIVTAGAVISVFLGNGDGSFQPRADYPRSSRATSANPAPRVPAWKRSPSAPDQWGNSYFLAAGDVNGDGAPDLALSSNGGTSGVSVLLGNGDGSFGTQTEYAVLDYVSAIAIGDVSGDGKADIVTSNDFAGGVSILLGNGAGAFPTRADYKVDGFPLSVGIRDVNGDGKPDLVTCNSPGSVSVIHGNGDGTLRGPRTYPIGRQSFGISVGDLDGDGKLDAVSANWDNFNVSALFGNGDGTLQPRIDLPAYIQPRSLAVGDLNGDGRSDIAFGEENGGVVSVYLSHGDRTFSPRADYFIPETVISVAIGDVNRDGNADLVASNPGGTGVLSVLLGNGDGTFQARKDTEIGNYGYLALGDFNGDSRLDAAVSTPFPSGHLLILMARGDGTFRTPVDYAIPSGFSRPVIADVNGDGRSDVLVGGVAVLLGNGDGTFQTPVNSPTGSPASSVGDLNGDGKLDLVTCKSGITTFLPGNGDGTFGTPEDYFTGRAGGLSAIGDMDRDGRPDVLLADSYGNTLSILRNIGPARPSLTARVQLDPDVINLGSKGTSLTAYIEPSGFSPSEIDVASIRLFGSVPPATAAGVIADHDLNGAPDLAVKFRRADVDRHLSLGVNHLELSGSLRTGATFRGSDDILVQTPQRGPRLASVAPNPWNPATSLSFHVETAGPVRIRLFDRGGRLVRTILDDPAMTAGLHHLSVDGRGAGGASLASGVYFYRIETTGNPIRGRLAIVK